MGKLEFGDLRWYEGNMVKMLNGKVRCDICKKVFERDEVDKINKKDLCLSCIASKEAKNTKKNIKYKK